MQPRRQQRQVQSARDQRGDPNYRRRTPSPSTRSWGISQPVAIQEPLDGSHVPHRVRVGWHHHPYCRPQPFDPAGHQQETNGHFRRYHGNRQFAPERRTDQGSCPKNRFTGRVVQANSLHRGGRAFAVAQDRPWTGPIHDRGVPPLDTPRFDTSLDWFPRCTILFRPAPWRRVPA
jgi:hypothetical protein